MSNVRVCVDVVGGDEKPQVVLDGIEAALAADPDIEVLAAGPAEIVNPFAASHARVEALEAPDVIAMDDDPIRAVMTKRKSSIVLACRAIKKGNADAFFSAGSTGAMTAAATAYVTPFRYMAEGKKQPVRPCLTNALPNRAGGLTVLCDMGANPDVEVDDMVRFAQMGSAYAASSWASSIPAWACLPMAPRTRRVPTLPSLLPGHESRRSRLCGQLRRH